MKAFELKYDITNCAYQDEMVRILDYLTQYGTLNISPKKVEEYYRKYSDEFWAAGWMGVDESILPSFAVYLSEQEI